LLGRCTGRDLHARGTCLIITPACAAQCFGNKKTKFPHGEIHIAHFVGKYPISLLHDDGVPQNELRC
jgi:hypothetical protein